MAINFVCYSKCSTCKKAKKWLIENGIEFDEIDIVTNKPTADELKLWIEKSNLSIKKFFNTSGVLYREMGLKDKINDMTFDEQIEVLASDGKMVKRPILITDNNVLVGFKEKEWEEVFK